MENLVWLLITILIIVIIVRQDRAGRNRDRDEEGNPIRQRNYYLIKAYSLISHNFYSEYIKENKEESIKLANELTRDKRIDGRVGYEKVEVYYHYHSIDLIYEAKTKYRINIDKLDGFNIDKYPGELSDFGIHELPDLNQIGKLYLLLTSGEELLVENPSYSLQDNSLYGQFISNMNLNRIQQSQDYRIIPMKIIDKILDSKKKRKSYIKL